MLIQAPVTASVSEGYQVWLLVEPTKKAIKCRALLVEPTKKANY